MTTAIQETIAKNLDQQAKREWVPELPKEQKARLRELESRIEKAAVAFAAKYEEVGQALVSIEHEQLYKPAYNTMAEYAKARFGLEAAMTSNMMNAARTNGALRERGHKRLPSNEGQTRELWHALKPEKGSNEPRVDVLDAAWRECLKREDEGEKITADMCRSVVRPDTPTSKPKAKPKKPATLPVFDGFAFTANVWVRGTDEQAKALQAKFKGASPTELNGGGGECDVLCAANDVGLLLDTIKQWYANNPVSAFEVHVVNTVGLKEAETDAE